MFAQQGHAFFAYVVAYKYSHHSFLRLFVFCLVFFHKVRKGAAGLGRYGVVGRYAAAAYKTVTADAYEPALFAFGDKVFFQFLRGQVKGNVHQAAAVFFGVPAVKTTAGVNNVINKLRLFAVACGNGLYAALRFNPVQGFVNHVNGKYRRCVVQ